MSKKNLDKLFLTLAFTLIFTIVVTAGTTTYTVKKGDTLWKIARTYEVGISEIIGANPQIKNPDLIYPNQKVNVPLPDETLQGIEEEILDLVNAERQKNNLSPLKLDWQVSRVAQYKSEDMGDNNYFSHNSPTYGSPFDMLKSFNISYNYAGENIAKGQKTPTAVMNAWMNSSGHRENILNSKFTTLGVGYYVKNGTIYWTQIFTG
ncbi:MAG: SafA/ExsA family spore coat assembly protein [Lachnospirales bacterium]